MVKLSGYGEAAGLWWSCQVMVMLPGYGDAAGYGLARAG